MSRCWRLGAVCLALAMTFALAPSASAVVVHSRGQFLGVAPRPGVATAAITGSVTTAHAAATASTTSSAWDNLSYQGGPVLHSSAPYLIFWAPSGESVPASWQTLITRYFTDVAADSTKPTNAYAVARQFTDGTGFADYQQTFDPGHQVLQDADPYPARDATNCGTSPYATCLTDDQLQTEISALIAANGLPSDGATGAGQLPASAPIYFVVLPSDVDVCFGDGSGTCASTDFCAYHSAYADGANQVLYATIPALALADTQDAKGCQWDGNPLVQEPNGSMADVALKYISHEDNETITDPLGTAWWNWYTGYENGDNCNDYEIDPNAFLPTLGGDAGAGALYNQLIDGDPYYLQSEWSNGGSSCLMQPSSGTITPRFAVPAGPRTAGSALTFDPATSASTYRISSQTWSFGDGTPTSFHAGRTLTSATHTYAAPGNYTVTLTLVDNRGNLSTTSEQISVGTSPTAVLSASTTQPLEGSTVSFDASGSIDDSASIDSYAWDFGDGTTGTGATPSHVYADPGTYLVRLTVTDGLGRVDTATSKVSVLDEPPVAAFVTGAATPEAGQSVPFDGSSSNDPDGSITRYAWNFGDGHTGSGATPSHTYASAGTYTATLTVTDSSAQKSSVSHEVMVLAGPTARLTASTTQPVEGAAVGFDAGDSAGGGSGAAIVSYAWSFGDGATGAGATASHVYAAPGPYTVKLTVTDAAGASASVTEHVTVLDEPPTAAFAATPTLPTPGATVSFDASGSSDPDGAIVSYAWSFGDGHTGSGATPSHTYASPGTYTVRLTVVDRSGASATVSHSVTVYVVPHSTFTHSPSLPVEGTAATFSADALTSDAGATASSYSWSFGDGATGSGATVAHTYAHQGSYRVTLTVTDVFGLTSTTSEVVAVIDAPPTAVIAILTRHPVRGHAVTLSGTHSHDRGPIVSYLWHFGDGSGAVGQKLTHTFARAGSYRVSLTVRDSFGHTGTTTVTVTVARTGAITKARRSYRRGRSRSRARRSSTRTPRRH